MKEYFVCVSGSLVVHGAVHKRAQEGLKRNERRSGGDHSRPVAAQVILVNQHQKLEMKATSKK